MRSAREPRTFHLTTVSSRSARQVTPRSRPKSFELKFHTLSVFSDQLTRLRSLAAELRAKNNQLKAEISMFREHVKDASKRQGLVDGFEATLASCLKDLELRKQKVQELEKQVMIFRPAEKEEAPAPRKISTARLQRIAAANSRRKPQRRPFPPPSLLPNKRSDPVRAQELKEHRDLIERSLYLERLIVIQKMKLKICHDHRIMEQLKQDLSQIEDIDDDSSDDLQSQRNKIQNLREQVMREKERIREEKDENNFVHFAAVSIQSAWRGYLQRHKKT